MIPDKVQRAFESLVADRTMRTAKSLRQLHLILEDYVENGHRSFSVTDIGRYSEQRGGPSYSSIRATKNPHFRALIHAWEEEVRSSDSVSLQEWKDEWIQNDDFSVIDLITDHRARIFVGQLIAERNRYRSELAILKNQSEFVIDRRPRAPAFADTTDDAACSSRLSQQDAKILRKAISNELMRRNAWIVTDSGQVVSEEDGNEVFHSGFVDAIKHALGEV